MAKLNLIVLIVASCAASSESALPIQVKDVMSFANGVLTDGTKSHDLAANIRLAQDFVAKNKDQADPRLVKVMSDFVNLGSLQEQLQTKEGARCQLEDIEVLSAIHQSLLDNSDRSPYGHDELLNRLNKLTDEVSSAYAGACFAKLEQDFLEVASKISPNQQQLLMMVGLSFLGYNYQQSQPLDALRFAVEKRHVQRWTNNGEGNGLPQDAAEQNWDEFKQIVKFVCPAVDSNEQFVDLADRTLELASSVNLSDKTIPTQNREGYATMLLLSSSYQVCKDLKSENLDEVVENMIKSGN